MIQDLRKYNRVQGLPWTRTSHRSSYKLHLMEILLQINQHAENYFCVILLCKSVDSTLKFVYHMRHRVLRLSTVSLIAENLDRKNIYNCITQSFHQNYVTKIHMPDHTTSFVGMRSMLMTYDSAERAWRLERRSERGFKASGAREALELAGVSANALPSEKVAREPRVKYSV